MNPFKHLTVVRKGKSIKRVEPYTWFARWLRLLLTVIAVGTWLLVFAALLIH